MKKNNKPKRVLLVGGGTGGHIVPIYNLAANLSQQSGELDVYIVGNGSEIEKNFYSGDKNYLIMKTGKLDRSSVINTFLQVVASVGGFIRAYQIIQRVKPSLIFSKGGYVSLPIILWARILKLPYFIHESDIEIGRTNRFSARGAKKIFVGFPKKYYRIDNPDRVIHTGQILSSVADSATDFDFGFGNKPIILVTGGSQGARLLNKVVFKSLTRLLDQYNIIHQTGSQGYEEGIEVRSRLVDSMKKSYFVRDFLTSSSENSMMASAVFQADLVVARAGATTMAEIASMKKPMILVPYPHASGDHQLKNAHALEKQGGCKVILDRDFTPELLEKNVTTLLGDKDKMKMMGKAAKDFFPDDGLDIISEEIVNYLKG